MNKKVPWYRWPEDPLKNRPAWFVILRRLVFLPIATTGITIATLGFLLMYGRDEAEDLWKHFFN
jgi:hypothetical protein